MRKIIIGLILLLLTVSDAEDGFIETDTLDPEEPRIIIVENKLLFIVDTKFNFMPETKNPFMDIKEAKCQNLHPVPAAE